MLRWAAILFIASIVAAVLGFGGLSEAAAEAAQLLFFVFLGFFAITLILGLVSGGRK